VDKTLESTAVLAPPEPSKPLMPSAPAVPEAARPVPPAAAPGRLRLLIRLGRPKFLVQSTMVVGLGVSLSVVDGHPFRPGAFVLTLLFAWCTHLMTHYCNEYFDLEADQANTAPTSWTGGSRVLVNGLLNPITSLSTAFVLLFVSVGLIAAMPTTGARAVAGVVVTLSWFYTAPPLRLNYRALGETACAVVLYGLGPLLACLLQTRTLTGRDLLYVGIVCLLQFLRMSVMNLSDLEGDRATGKRTLAVALTAPGLIRLYLGGQLTVAVGVLLAWWQGLVPASCAMAVLAVMPVAAWVAAQLVRGALRDPARANAITFWASMHLPLTTCALTVSLLAQAAGDGRQLNGAWLTVYGCVLTVFAAWLFGAVRRNPVLQRAPRR
jgi:1,4-dihydroxy-2-naphthoate octaprenyltransferase